MTVMEGEATSGATPDKVWDVLVDPARMPQWFTGARDVEVSDGWPATGGRLRFRVGPSRFDARVVESQPPRRLVVDVQTPSARSRVTSSIDPHGAGARYRRAVDAEWKGLAGRLLGPLFIGPSVKREARHVAKLAEQG